VVVSSDVLSECVMEVFVFVVVDDFDVFVVVVEGDSSVKEFCC